MTFKEWEGKHWFCKEKKTLNTKTLFWGEGGHLFPNFRFLRGWSWMITFAKKRQVFNLHISPTQTHQQPLQLLSHLEERCRTFLWNVIWNLRDTIYQKFKKTHFKNTYYTPVHTKQVHKLRCFQGTLTQGVIWSEEIEEPYGGRKQKQASVSCEKHRGMASSTATKAHTNVSTCRNIDGTPTVWPI